MVSEVTTLPARVVGIPKANIASEHKNSRIEDRNTFRPSDDLKIGKIMKEVFIRYSHTVSIDSP